MTNCDGYDSKSAARCAVGGLSIKRQKALNKADHLTSKNVDSESAGSVLNMFLVVKETQQTQEIIVHSVSDEKLPKASQFAAYSVLHRS